MSSIVESAIRALRVRMANLISRAIVNYINDAFNMQKVQVSIYADEVCDGVDHPQEYGLSSNCPVSGAISVVVSPNGHRDNILSLVVANPSLRIKGLAPGETVLYNALASTSVTLKEDGTIEADTDLLKSTGDVADSVETLDSVRQRLNNLIEHYNAHLHPITGAVPAAPPTPPASTAIDPPFQG